MENAHTNPLPPPRRKPPRARVCGDAALERRPQAAARRERLRWKPFVGPPAPPARVPSWLFQSPLSPGSKPLPQPWRECARARHPAMLGSGYHRHRYQGKEPYPKTSTTIMRDLSRIFPVGPLFGSGSVWCCSGEFTSPNGGVKPPLHQIDPLPAFHLRLLNGAGSLAPLELSPAVSGHHIKRASLQSHREMPDLQGKPANQDGLR